MNNYFSLIYIHLHKGDCMSFFTFIYNFFLNIYAEKLLNNHFLKYLYMSKAKNLCKTFFKRIKIILLHLQQGRIY